MLLISLGEAQNILADLKDGNGKPVDKGIADALVGFIRVTEALGIRTSQSCEGHIDWGYPFPWIEFQVPNERYYIPSFWKLWRRGERMWGKQQNMMHASNAEQKTVQMCSMFTRFLVEHDTSYVIPPESILHIVRSERFRFRLMPARFFLSEGYKSSGDNVRLNLLLEEQRIVFRSFASFCVRQLEHESNLVGIPSEGCPGCMGRG